MDIVDRMFELVDAKYKEQKDFAADVGVHPTRVSEWRLRKSASYQRRLPKIAEVLNTTTEYLLTGNGVKSYRRSHLTIRPPFGEKTMEVAEAYDTASPDLQAAVRRVLGIDDTSIAARGGKIIKMPSPPNEQTLDELSAATAEKAKKENEQY